VMDASNIRPPNAVEAEEALLGAILRSPDAIDGVRHIVEPADFFEEVNGWLYEALCSRRDAGEHIDIRLVMTMLGNRDLGGVTVGEYLGRLGAEATTIINAPHYAKAVREASRMRRLLDTAKAAQAAMCTGGIADPASYAAQMIEDLDDIASGAVAEHMRRIGIGNSAAGVIERVQEARAGRVRHGAPFGLPSLDQATLGMRQDQLIILAGRPGMGKTTAAVHFALSAARAGFGVCFVSLEMNASELSERALSAVAYDPRQREHLTYRAIAHGRDISDVGLERLVDAQRSLNLLPLDIEQQPGLTIAQIAARVRQYRLRLERSGESLGLVVIDHIGLIKPSKRYAGNRVQEIAEITGSLKGLAKELGTPVLALSQLSRQVEGRDDKRPKLVDLRDSGSIEQDADVVIALFREAYYLEHQVQRSDEEEDRFARCQNELEIEILKQRSGPTTRVTCFCDVASNVLAEVAR
jgi:replicative DNA helicase